VLMASPLFDPCRVKMPTYTVGSDTMSTLEY